MSSLHRSMLIMSPPFPLVSVQVGGKWQAQTIPQMETPQAIVRLKHATVAPSQALLALRLGSHPGCRVSFVLQRVFGSPAHKSITKNDAWMWVVKSTTDVQEVVSASFIFGKTGCSFSERHANRLKDEGKRKLGSIHRSYMISTASWIGRPLWLLSHGYSHSLNPEP